MHVSLSITLCSYRLIHQYIHSKHSKNVEQYNNFITKHLMSSPFSFKSF